jgi:hypothetical protein
MLSEEHEMIWLCGLGDALGDAADAAAAAAFGLECALNAIESTSTMMASGANATAEIRVAQIFMADLTSVDLEQLS